MKKITKEMCIVFIKDYYKSNPIALVIFSIFALVALWFFTENIAIVSILAAVALAAIFFIIYRTNKKVNDINSEDFYLAEDVVVDLKKDILTAKPVDQGTIIFTHFVITENIPYIKVPTQQ